MVPQYSSTLAWKIHGWRSLVGCSPWGRKESDPTERLHFHFSLSCIGEGNGNPLQCSCLENPMDWGSLVGCRLWGRTESDTTEATQQQHSSMCLVGFLPHLVAQMVKHLSAMWETWVQSLGWEDPLEKEM